MNNRGYLIKLQNEDKYWSAECKTFVKLDDVIHPTVLDLDSSIHLAIDLGRECMEFLKICNEKGKVLKSYSKKVEVALIPLLLY